MAVDKNGKELKVGDSVVYGYSNQFRLLALIGTIVNIVPICIVGGIGYKIDINPTNVRSNKLLRTWSHTVTKCEAKKRFADLYEMCIEKHGLAFAQKVYEGCREPLWIGMDKMIAVFEHHCDIKNELSKKLEERRGK